jgi:C4-dicarboxylate transporter DctM subunit
MNRTRRPTVADDKTDVAVVDTRVETDETQTAAARQDGPVDPPETRFMSILNRVVRWSTGGLLVFACGALALLMFLTLADVILRYLFNRPIAESYELTQICLLVITFLGLAYVGLHKGHVRITVISDRLGERGQMILRLVVDTLSLAFFVMLAWQAYVQIELFFEAKQIFSNLRFPVYWTRIALFVGCIPLCLVLLRDLISDFSKVYRDSRRKFGIYLCVAVVVTFVVALFPFWRPGFDLSALQWAGIGLAVFFIMTFSGMTIASSMGLAGFWGVACLSGVAPGLNLMGQIPASVAMNYNYSIIPLFILMGAFAFHSGVVADFYHAFSRWVGHVPGGLAVGTLAGCAGFAAVCGSSVASSAAMSKIVYPELERYNYDGGYAAGTIAAGGTLGILIPPSMDFIIYGVLTMTSIGTLLIAGILPGILMVTIFMATALLVARWKPGWGPATERYSLKEKMKVLPKGLPVVVLFIVVIGGIYAGIFTPIEGASIGCVGALILALVKRKLTGRLFIESLKDSVNTSAMILIILIGAMMFGYFLAFTGVPKSIAGFLTALPINRWAIIFMIMVVYILLGCLMDAFSVMIITVPILFPAVMALGFDPIWYGVLMICTVELGLISPPFGMACFVVAGTTKVPVAKVFRGVLPYFIAQIVVVLILMAFPAISLFLPGLMGS